MNFGIGKGGPEKCDAKGRNAHTAEDRDERLYFFASTFALKS